MPEHHPSSGRSERRACPLCACCGARGWSPGPLNFRSKPQAFASFDPARVHAETAWRRFIVALRDDVLVGMVQVEDDQVAHLHVDPARWNEGAGATLLDAAERLAARTRPIVRLEMRGFNSRARAFYAGHGWREVRSYPGVECGSPVETVEMRERVRA